MQTTTQPTTPQPNNPNYLTIQPPPGTQAPMAQFSGTTPVTGISQNNAGVALGSVDPNQLMSGQLEQYLRGNSPIVRDAADQGAALAAARGGGANSSMYARSAATGAIDALRPVAQFDAARYGAVQDQNLDALNQQNIERMGNQNAQVVAGINVGPAYAQIAENRRQYDIDQHNRLQSREWELADQDTQARASQRSQIFNQMLGTIFSDPSFWRDPQAAMGMFNTYSANFDAMFQQLFPEYFDTTQNSGMPAGGTP